MTKKGRGRGKPKVSQGSQPAQQPGAEKTEPGCVQRAPNLCVTEPCRPGRVNSVQPQHRDSKHPQSLENVCLQRHSIPNPGKDAGTEDFSSAHKVLENRCGYETSKQKTEKACADVPPKEVPVNSAMNNLHSMPPSTSVIYTQPELCPSEPLRFTKMDIVRRPNHGTLGRQIAVVANYFLLKGRGNDIYHYDIEIEDSGRRAAKTKTIREYKDSAVPQLEIQQKRNVGKQRCREIINQLIKDKALKRCSPFYDGQKNLYTFQPLPIKGKATAEVTLFDGERMKKYRVTVQSANKNGAGNVIDLESLNTICEGRSREIPHEAVMAFDMILCHRDPPFFEVNVGRSFFSFSEMRKDQLDGQVEIWKGYNQSVHLTQRGPAVVVNLATKAFHSAGFVIEHACSILGFDITTVEKLSHEDIQKLSKSLSNIKIEVTHLPYPRRYTVLTVSKSSAENLMVDIGGQNMSVAQFFSQKYKKLKFPKLPCLSMRSTGKPTYTPMECCLILPGQPKLGKLDKKQSADMINKTAIPPSERFRAIENYVKTIQKISGPNVNSAGMEMELSPMNLMARIISPPALAYRNEPSVQPDDRGVWRIDGKNFTKTSKSAQWALISFGRPDICPDSILVELSNTLVRASVNVGLNLNQPVAIRSFDRRTCTYDALRFAMRSKVDFVFAILSRNDRYHSYDELKFFADVKLGLITQCMEDIVVPKCCRGPGNGQIINNLFSKINIKLGGVNHTFSKQPSVSMRGTIVMGADAAHSPRGSKCPSIAAVVGSVDEVPFQYAVSCKVQMNPDQSKRSQEIILDMKNMTKHILQSYREKNPTVPERIIFFRDGVSEGQFETVLQSELKSIQRACHELFKRTLPVTFIVVQKRHQTRFIPRNPRDGVGRAGNVPPGTTVDTDVVHPVHFDFFICSHEGIKGTSKPAHYVVLHDDNRFRADDLQKFCYDLCHVYARCNRSISIPAPAMNAHLAAARAKKYIDWHILNDAGSSSGYSSDDMYSLPREVIDFVNNISTIKAPMFFV